VAPPGISSISTIRYQREGLYVPPKTKRPELCTNFGIASVFTPAHNRGKGYASHMMRLLHWVFAPECALDRATFPAEWGNPPTPLPRRTSVTFSVLYSDIGEAFYRNCGPTPGAIGWQVVSPIDTVFDIKDLQSRLESLDLPSSEWQWLFEAEAVQIWEGDSKEMDRDLSQETSTAHRLCIFPRGGTAGYLNRRVTEVAPSNSNQSQITWGVQCSDHSQALSFATWCPDTMAPTSATITITRLRANAETFPIILRALCQYAGDQDPVYERLEIWNLAKRFQSLASNLGGTTVTRAEHLDALRVYGADGENIEWQFNERFALLYLFESCFDV
jgi:hypothetical protein